MNIYLIRHGESTGDIEDRFGGNYDDHLTQLGREQAQKMASKLTGKKIEHIFASPLIRAKETAACLKSELVKEVEILPKLRERNQYGILTGKVKSDTKRTHPHLVELLKDYNNTIDGAESYEDFKSRIFQAIEFVTSKKFNTVAIITHGGPIKVLLRHILNTNDIRDIKDCGYCLISSNNHSMNLFDDESLYL